MFSLIITVISIALVAALALATIYYGGSAFNKGSAKADAQRFLSSAAQVEAAILLAKADIASGAISDKTLTIETLVADKYLAQPPKVIDNVWPAYAYAWNFGSLAICNELEKSNGRPGYASVGDMPFLYGNGAPETELSGKFGCGQNEGQPMPFYKFS